MMDRVRVWALRETRYLMPCLHFMQVMTRRKFSRS